MLVFARVWNLKKSGRDILEGRESVPRCASLSSLPARPLGQVVRKSSGARLTLNQEQRIKYKSEVSLQAVRDAGHIPHLIEVAVPEGVRGQHPCVADKEIDGP